MLFQNWLDSRLKLKTLDPNVYPTIWGGVSRGFWSPFLDLGARSAIFWHLKMGTLAKSARFQVSKNGTSKERPNLRKDSKNLAKHLPKWWGRHLGRAFLFLGRYQVNFEKSYIFQGLGAVFPLYRPKTISVVQSAKYRVICLKICMQIYFMVVQAVLERRSSKLILSI